MAKNKVRVQTQLKLESVDPGMEMAGAEKGDLRLDLSLSGSIHLKELTKLLEDDHASAMLEHLYDAEGNLRTGVFDMFKVGTKVKDCVIQLGAKEDGCVMPDSSFDKITLIPMPGRTFEMKARAQVYPKPKQESRIVYDFYKTTIKVIVDGGTRVLDEVDQTEMPLENPAEGAE